VDPTKPALAIAFEGTLSEGVLGEFSKGHASIEGSMDALQELNRKYRLIICTSSPATKLSEIADWIARNRGPRHFTFEVTNTRPAAAFYIEKRGLKFESWQQVLNSLEG
jgi:hypothetical protein